MLSSSDRREATSLRTGSTAEAMDCWKLVWKSENRVFMVFRISCFESLTEFSSLCMRSSKPRTDESTRVRMAQDCCGVKPEMLFMSVVLAELAFEDEAMNATGRKQRGNDTRGFEPPHVRVPQAAVMLETTQVVPRSQNLSQNGYG